VTTSPSLAQLGDAVRFAVATGDFLRGGRLWASYAALLQASLASEPEPAARVQEARALIDWARQACEASHARLRDELSGARICLRYCDPPAPPHRILRVRA
jgi:hypothetical protein